MYILKHTSDQNIQRHPPSAVKNVEKNSSVLWVLPITEKNTMISLDSTAVNVTTLFIQIFMKNTFLYPTVLKTMLLSVKFGPRLNPILNWEIRKKLSYLHNHQEDPSSVQGVLQHVPHEHGEAGEEGVEAPVLWLDGHWT